MDWKEVKRDLLKDPAVRREWEASEPEYQLARAIIRQRLAKGLSQRQLANRIGTKQPVISRLESGESKPTLSLLKRVAEALDANVIVTLEEKTKARPQRAAKRKAS